MVYPVREVNVLDDAYSRDDSATNYPARLNAFVKTIFVQKILLN